MKLASSTAHQIVGFHFSVFFFDLPGEKEVDIKFQSISGLDVQIEKETLKEGGENRFEHNIPGRRKYSPLTLKRGVLTPKDSGLTTWCQKAFQELSIEPLSRVDIELLNENHDILMQWELSHVWPVSWKIGELNAERGEVLIETIELNYNYYKLVTVT
ncbi:phage tail protein [Aquimarina sediminis]|uniref:phage tail protein n=1 Tax=Aquimarina sediminis TaxID=2070536 RepID=UPI000CA01E31|nr:phage tail protein [Aquimarina sediminis]